MNGSSIPTVGLLQMYVHLAKDSCINGCLQLAIVETLHLSKRVTTCSQFMLDCLFICNPSVIRSICLDTDLLFVFYAALVISRLTNNALSGTLPNLNALNQLEYV